MAKDLVVQRKSISKYRGEFSRRAAQYVRMSTIHQRYSIQNQAAAIAAYADRHNITIVRTYRDEGISGLRIEKREGLKQLIADVCSGRADFNCILVYDVSRWGRFQDTDESAHYEFLCKKAGIRVEYCAEQFDNDGTLLSSIVKNLKRVMAAEFSRELSVKVHAGLCRVSALGFRVGAPLPYGLRREMVDENRISKGALKRGQQKHLKTDRVILKLGPPEEIAVVQRIFREFADQRTPTEEIARGLNRDAVPNHRRRPWTSHMVKYLLKNENYIGNSVYNRISNRLRLRQVSNPTNEWIRSDGILPPVVDRDLFLRAQKRLTLRWERLTDDEILRRLKALFEKEGRLNQLLINKTLGLPSMRVFANRFGSLRNAYQLVGYHQTWNADWIEHRGEFNSMISHTATDLIGRLEKAGSVVRFEAKTDVLTVGKLAISLRLARSWRSEKRKLIWTVYSRTVMPKGLILAMRLDEHNREVLDYLVLPTRRMTKGKIRFMEAGLKQLTDYRYPNLSGAAKAIVKHATKRAA